MIRFINEFDKELITRHLNYNLKSIDRYQESFEYVKSHLATNNVKELADCIFYETKSYNYYLIEEGNVSIIIRHYQTHFTLFMKNRVMKSYGEGHVFEESRYSIATFYVERDKREEYIEDNNFFELNKSLPDIIKMVSEDDVHMMWNNLCLVVDKSVEVKCVLVGESFYNVDTYIFALEELFRLHFQMFCETEVVAKLDDFNVGDTFKGGVITKIKKEDWSYGDKPYYHGIGISYTDSNGKDKWDDVYSLARWAYDDLFGKEEFEWRRLFRIKHIDGEKYGISYNRGFWAVHHEHNINDKIVYASTEDVEIVKELLKADFLDTNKVEVEEKKIKINK